MDVVLLGGRYKLRTDCFDVTFYSIKDPSLSSKSKCSPSFKKRLVHSATVSVMYTGEIMLTGGAPDDDADTKCATTSWFKSPWSEEICCANMTAPRIFHTATPLLDGRLLVVGGVTKDKNPSSSVEIYDPSTDTWTRKAELPHPRRLHSAVLLDSDTMLVVGGVDNRADANTLLYHISTDKWESIESMNDCILCGSVCLLPNGNVILTGGYRPGHFEPVQGLDIVRFQHVGPVYLKDCKIYDTKMRNWYEIAPMKIGRSGHSCVLVDGKVVVMGGLDSQTSSGTSSVEIYDIQTGEWCDSHPLQKPIFQPFAYNPKLRSRYSISLEQRMLECIDSRLETSIESSNKRQRYF